MPDIIRIFTVLVPAELQTEFEPLFQSVSLTAVKNAAGCKQVKIAKPSLPSTNEYLMISVWEDVESLAAFAGEDWRQPHIPSGMERFVKSCAIRHYDSFE